MKSNETEGTDSRTWEEIESATGWSIPESVRQGCVGPKLVTIPAGRELFAAGTENKDRMEWAAFDENDIEWYLQGNQLNQRWYTGSQADSVPLYEFTVVLNESTRAIMSKVARQTGVDSQSGPSKFQYYSPIGFGNPVRLRLLGYLSGNGIFHPALNAA